MNPCELVRASLQGFFISVGYKCDFGFTGSTTESHHDDQTDFE